MGNKMGMCPCTFIAGSPWCRWTSTRLCGELGDLLSAGQAQLVRVTSCLRSVPNSPAPLRSLGERKTRSLVVWRCSADCTVGTTLMIIFCIPHIRPRSRWDGAAVTRSGNWAAVQKQSGLCTLDHLWGRIAAGTLRAGQWGACQQSFLAWFVDMLDGVWGCLDLSEASAVVEW